jgi:hypothetical protein
MKPARSLVPPDVRGAPSRLPAMGRRASCSVRSALPGTGRASACGFSHRIGVPGAYVTAWGCTSLLLPSPQGERFRQ